MAYEMFKILIVDDNEVILSIYEKYLSTHHYSVIKARDGKEGIRKAFQERPDVILLDIMMPEMSGFEVCATLREAPSTWDVPIIMLTALDKPDARQRALALGADDFVAKTESMDTTEGRIKMLLKQRILAHTRSSLTDLAGSTVIEYATRNILSSGRPVGFLFINLTGMARFNETVSYKDGDRLLKMVAAILKDETQKRGEGDFTGYAGADDFVILCRLENAAAMAQSICSRYDEGINQLSTYSPSNPYPGMVIAVVLVENGKEFHPGQLARLSAYLLQQAKDHPDQRIQTSRPIGKRATPGR